jgi:anti-sigma B factor antagonist
MGEGTVVEVGTIETVGNVSVLTLTDTFLDASNAPALKQRVAALAERSPRLVLDLGRVDFVDSSGCGAILTCLRQVNGLGGKLAVYGVTRPVQALFELVRMNRILEVFDTRDSAVAAVGG